MINLIPSINKWMFFLRKFVSIYSLLSQRNSDLKSLVETEAAQNIVTFVKFVWLKRFNAVASLKEFWEMLTLL